LIAFIGIVLTELSFFARGNQKCENEKNIPSRDLQNLPENLEGT
jgi:hypothetical protein